MADTEEGRRLAGLEEELARLGVSKALLAETMGEKEEETARRLREAKDKQVWLFVIAVIVVNGGGVVALCTTTVCIYGAYVRNSRGYRAPLPTSVFVVKTNSPDRTLGTYPGT